MRRGGCPFSQKAGNAQASGAAAALVGNDGSPGRTAPISATLFGPGVRIPVLVVSSELAPSSRAWHKPARCRCGSSSRSSRRMREPRT
jgi:hypothetical protein